MHLSAEWFPLFTQSSTERAAAVQASTNYLPAYLSLDWTKLFQARELFIHHAPQTSLSFHSVTDAAAVVLEAFVMQTSTHWEQDEDHHLISQRSAKSWQVVITSSHYWCMPWLNRDLLYQLKAQYLISSPFEIRLPLTASLKFLKTPFLFQMLWYLIRLSPTEIKHFFGSRFSYLPPTPSIFSVAKICDFWVLFNFRPPQYAERKQEAMFNLWTSSVMFHDILKFSRKSGTL